MKEWLDWPAKSAHPPETIEHPAIYHMLDVAAVAEQLLAESPWPSALKQAFIALAGLHDLGKFSETFRGMLREGAYQPFTHWELTEILLLTEDDWLAEWLGGTEDVREVLYAAVAGHHGRPPQTNLQRRELRKCLRAVGDGHEAAQRLLEIFRQLWPEASLDSLDEEAATSFSWWLPGFCTAADWIGSNTTWFSPKELELEPEAYLKEARAIAQKAVKEAGLSGTTAREGELFDFALRPLQEACVSLTLPEGPALVVLEAETGVGKTEAALILVQRMILAGKGRGLFFALPTMATADAMFGRARRVMETMFTNPSLTLAHGRAGLSVPFRDLVNEGSRTGKSDDQSGVTSAEWLASDNRRALLADVGIGTIDQALLSVLPVRFQTLRHYGLASKILVVDEVHEMGEPYIAEELVALLQMHRAMGGSAILLTATLPLKLRARLLETYGGISESHAYPAITVAGGETVTQFDDDARPQKGPVMVERLSTMDEAVRYIAQSAAGGAACVWVRNAVDDAIAAVDALRAEGVQAHLLHARFALCDRKKLEQEVLDRVGRNGTGRKGFVLVATQIVEASLDLDFDVMVSDLAPIGSLIQRVGRLWRHMDVRPATQRPVPAPVLKVLSPDPAEVQDDRWLQKVLERGAWVYSLPDMWRTASVLFKAGQIRTLDGLRSLIEAVHGDEVENLPSVLDGAEAEGCGKAMAARHRALQNLATIEDGYRKGGCGADDTTYPTRLGDETRILALARQTDHGLVPWAQAEGVPSDELGRSELAALWALSEVSVRSRRLVGLDLPDQDRADIQEAQRYWPQWKKKAVTICPVHEIDGAICQGVYYRNDIGLLIYHSS
ncbi:CRISPR-associated helicase Cas3, protein [Parasaccharibacter apium]|uniref:CRISPR-associated helicase Cas3, protein n=1 Tax=Parasaccharibacter apium TaxID=1510841 RepID=A0A7U7J1P4_9PROT|nr:CRISPR-associated helicase Cas3' [Parasaccharibacter apium]CDG34519.1 CRISPR-associated helicase Cas3, protein [Parasaccharibacter apium]